MRKLLKYFTKLATAKQFTPVPNNLPPVKDMVIADLQARAEVGLVSYGVYLQPHNGRDPLIDAYQEALDLAMYLRQTLYEKYGE